MQFLPFSYEKRFEFSWNRYLWFRFCFGCGFGYHSGSVFQGFFMGMVMTSGLFKEASFQGLGWFLPCRVAGVRSPPLKCQGIKTRLVSFIARQVQWSGVGRWVEPFLGSGAVLFNLRPRRALAADNNPHLIGFYQALQTGRVTPEMVREYLAEEGTHLARLGNTHYLAVRERFNREFHPLDFLFLNRACFNGLMRFNGRGEFNVPFCHRPLRFTGGHLTRIVNQVRWVRDLLQSHDWELRVADWRECLGEVRADDFVYLDPPYFGRHTDYYLKWDMAGINDLAMSLRGLPCGYALSLWESDGQRTNPYLGLYTEGMVLRRCRHVYHLGAREDWRPEVDEVLLIHPDYAVRTDSVSFPGWTQPCLRLLVDDPLDCA